MRNRTVNALLTEIMLALLFFALASAVILQVFVAAHRESERAARLDEILFAAQTMADETYLTGRGAQTEAAGCVLTAVVAEEQTEAGSLRRSVVTAVDEAGNVLLTLPCSRYLPGGEVAP